MQLERTIRALGGVAATHELYADGATRWMLSAAVRANRLVRVRQGWYCLPEQDDAVVRAVRVGGTLGCVSAARHHGLSVRGYSAIHVVAHHHDARLRSEHDKSVRLVDVKAPGTVVHWRPPDPAAPRGIQTALQAVAQMATCVSPELVAAAADSAIRTGAFSRDAWGSAIWDLPQHLRTLLSEADGTAESITESVFRFRFRRLGLRMRAQVSIPGVGRVDFLIGTRLVAEVDGYSYHSDPDRFESDRRRDARLSALGFRVLRFSYRQVFERWHEVRASVLAAVARNDHR